MGSGPLGSFIFVMPLGVTSICMVLLPMPRYFFDLFFDRYVVLDPGGMVLEHKVGARAAAEQMARHLATVRSELRNGRSWIRVRDAQRNEVHRSQVGLDFRPARSPRRA